MMDAVAASPACVDASFVAALVLPEPVSATALAAWRGWSQDARLLLAPISFPGEVVSAIRRAGLRVRVTPEDEVEALNSFVDGLLPVIQVLSPDAGTWRRAWEWARRLGRANVYDTIYLAVAEESGAEFWTADENLERALTADGSPLPEWVHVVHPEPLPPATP